MLLRDVLGAARCERIVYVDHIVGIGRELLEAVRQVGAEGIVSKRRGSLYRGGESRDWLKTKCHETGVFVITGFRNSAKAGSKRSSSPRSATASWCPAGQVRFGFAGKGLWAELDRLRAGPRPEGRRAGAAGLRGRGQVLRPARRLHPGRRAASRSPPRR